MLFILVVVAIASIFYFLHRNYQYWKKRGVPGPEPTFLIGNVWENFLLRKSLADVYSDFYRKFPDAPLVGIFRTCTPTLIIRDPELIKDITVKSFQNFHDNDLYIDKEVDPLFGRNPFVLRGEEWKQTRGHLTPGFTSGKMKMVYPLLEEVSKQFVKYMEKHQINTHVKEVCMRFTLNNVGSCAFGLDAKCFEEENPEFKKIADRFFSPMGFHNFKVFLISVIPTLNKLVYVKFTEKDVEEKLLDMVTQTIKYREENNIVRNDFLHILYQQTKITPGFTNIDVTAHAAGFFGDGYETSSIVMHFLLYELALYPEAQNRLREEVIKVFEDNNDTLPYEELQKMSYLDACFNGNVNCFNEALRLHPPLGSLNKVCTKNYTYIPKENDVIKKPFVIEAETPVILPLYALHRDPKYFPEPDTFKPERFLPENKENLTKYSFLPFGEGPRACLGQRFGTLQVKIGTAYIIKNYEIVFNRNSPLPIRHDAFYFLTLPVGAIRLDFKKIL